MSKFHVNRHVTVVQSTVIDAPTKEEAIAKSRKAKWSAWKALDRKRRKNYSATKVQY